MAGMMQELVGERIDPSADRGAEIVSHILTSLSLIAIAATTAVADDTSLFTITTKRNDDRAEVRSDKGQTIFSIHSPFGISSAVIERTVETWPDSMVLRLHLKGLESFRATNDRMTLNAAVSRRDGKVRLWLDGKDDSLLNVNSPYWMVVRLVGGDGKLATMIPLEDGHFEVPLPRAFFNGNPKAITISWIDFYRD
jgi:hypothetical protein